jgi:hypothetical protein
MKLTEEQKTKLLEELSQLEHKQWVEWAKSILEKEDISEETQKRWKKDFIPYVDLPEEIKRLDRPFARKSLKVFEEFLEKL